MSDHNLPPRLSRSPDESPAWSADVLTSLPESPRNGGRLAQAGGLPRSATRTSGEALQSLLMLSSWVRILCEKNIGCNDEPMRDKQLEKHEEKSHKEIMDSKDICSILLDRFASQAAGSNYKPSPKRPGKEPFNVSQLIRDVWPESRPGNLEPWMKLRRDPEKMTIAEAVRLSQATGGEFLLDIAFAVDQARKKESSDIMFASAAEPAEPYNNDNGGNAHVA